MEFSENSSFDNGLSVWRGLGYGLLLSSFLYIVVILVAWLLF